MQIQRSESEYVNLVHAKGGVSWQTLLEELGGLAIEAGLAKEGIVEALLERERAYPTGVESHIGVAIPHADKAFTNRESVLVATLDEPVLFSPMGGGDSQIAVEVVFLLLLDDASRHTTILSTILRLIQDQEKIDALRGSQGFRFLTEVFET